jgi:exodeoxyribonuclease VII large subunit
VLTRGWSITRTADGRTLRSAADAAAGDELVTTLADGSVRSTVSADPAPADPAPGSTR